MVSFVWLGPMRKVKGWEWIILFYCEYVLVLLNWGIGLGTEGVPVETA